MAGAGVTIPPLQDYHNSSFVHPCLPFARVPTSELFLVGVINSRYSVPDGRLAAHTYRSGATLTAIVFARLMPLAFQHPALAWQVASRRVTLPH